ncbi:MAG: hypothetical protein JW888_09985, partial [Pirellulales bacterium]|nr:hypothetical protein [Pirellulales bacterium]
MLLFVRSMTFLAVAAVVAPAAVAADPSPPAELDWSAWRSLPVHASGRVMPLDTLARSLVEEICGRARPRLAPADADSVDPSGEGGAGQGNVVFPDGRSRRFTAAELVFSWLVEPERWENVPLLAARHETLRQDLLQLPLRDRGGARLQYVSPRQFEQASRAGERLAELALLQRSARTDGRPFEPSETDRRLEQLNEAYHAYRVLTFDPAQPRMRRVAFGNQLMGVFRTWRREVAQRLALWQSLDDEPSQQKLADEINKALKGLLKLVDEESFSLSAAEEDASRLCRSTQALSALVAQHRDRQFSSDDAKLAERRRRLMSILVSRTNELARRAHALCEAIYDNGNGLRVVPSLSPFALQDDGTTNRAAQPWIALQTLLVGSESVLDGYPDDLVTEVRQSFDEAKSVYLDRQAPDRAERFAKALRQFSAALRALGEAVEPGRRELLTDDQAVSVLVATAYPPAGSLDKEVFYNRLDPFLWSWVLTLGSVACLALGFGRLGKPMFFVGAAVLTVGQVFTIAGLCLRASITGMVPITNMYETVLFVGLTVALFGLWFALLPFVWPVLGAAWRVTAIAPTPQAAASAGLSGDLARWYWRAMPVLRVILTVAFVYVLAVAPNNPSEDAPIFPLLPTFASGAIGDVLGAITIWLVGLSVLVWLLWFLPRAVLTLSIGAVLAPKAVCILWRQRLAEPIERSVGRKPFLLTGAAVALLAYLLAYFV